MPSRTRDGLDLVRALLAMALNGLPLSPRTIEDTLQIGHGTLPRLLDGRMDLKLRHLLPLCAVLKIHPAELLQRGLPNWEATRRIDDWLPPEYRKASPPPTLSAEILDAIRTTVRDEISRAGLTPDAARQETAVPAGTPRDRGEKRAVAAKAPGSRRHGAR